MTDIGLCFYCLTEENKQAPAVTLHRGTGVCEKCAKEWSEQIGEAEAAIAEIPSMPPLTRPGQSSFNV